jgi:hypothetical protein
MTRQVDQPALEGPKPKAPPRQGSWWLVGGGLALLFLLARAAIDVLAIVAFCALLFALERTVGDWIADTTGSSGSKIIFLAAGCCGAWILLSIGGVRLATRHFFEAADERGFHSILANHLSVPASDDWSPPPSGGVPPSLDQPIRADAQASQPRESASAAPEAQPPSNARVLLRLGGQGDSVLFQADILSEGSVVGEGIVEFSIDGSRVASARVAAGRAEARVSNVKRGPHRASAKFSGSGRFAEAMSEAAFNR